tara:strand:- start:815 stop:1300 length:486 start_codon:yes stop_codon:yes gene_type:complete
MDSLLERQGHVVAQIGAARWAASTSAAPATKNIAEYIAKNIAKATSSPAGATIGIETLVAILIVNLTLFLIAEYLVGFVRLFELCLCGGIPRIAIRMKFHGDTSISLFEVTAGDVSVNAQDFVIISFCHVLPLAAYPTGLTAHLAGRSGVTTKATRGWLWD